MFTECYYWKHCSEHILCFSSIWFSTPSEVDTILVLRMRKLESTAGKEQNQNSNIGSFAWMPILLSYQKKVAKKVGVRLYFV